MAGKGKKVKKMSASAQYHAFKITRKQYEQRIAKRKKR